MSFGKVYERKHPAGGWEKLETLDDLKIGQIIRVNGSSDLRIDEMERGGKFLSFVANRVGKPDRSSEEDYGQWVHIEDPSKGMTPLESVAPQKPKPEKKAPKAPVPEAPAPAADPNSGLNTSLNSDLPSPAPIAKVTTKTLILGALAAGCGQTTEAVIAHIESKGNAIKHATVTWTIGQMVKTGELEKTPEGGFQVKGK